MPTIPLTTRGAQLLKDELHRLKTVDRPAVITAIAEARAQGDLSENAEYDAARERQGFIEGRIGELEGKLSNAQIIDPKLLDAEGRVVFGATIELEDLVKKSTAALLIPQVRERVEKRIRKEYPLHFHPGGMRHGMRILRHRSAGI